jgi:hypothetical protein
MKQLELNTTNKVDIEIIARHDPSTSPRARIELAIVRQLIDILAEAGYHFIVDDGGDKTHTDEPDEIIDAIFAVDEAYLFCRSDDGRPYTQVFLVLGNDGWDVIADYGMSLAPLLDPYLDFISEEQDKQ